MDLELAREPTDHVQRLYDAAGPEKGCASALATLIFATAMRSEPGSPPSRKPVSCIKLGPFKPEEF
jgi:hypothetical protein